MLVTGKRVERKQANVSFGLSQKTNENFYKDDDSAKLTGESRLPSILRFPLNG